MPAGIAKLVGTLGLVKNCWINPFPNLKKSVPVPVTWTELNCL